MNLLKQKRMMENLMMINKHFFRLTSKHIVLAVLTVVFLLFLPFVLTKITKQQSLQGIAATTSTDPNLKVAFIGDDGAGSGYSRVLNLIKNEKADLVIDGGDLDYKNDPALWDGQVTAALGASYPYFVAMGNHDKAQWPGYAAKIQARLSKVSDAVCSGSVGVLQECKYRGLHMVITAPGLSGSGHDQFIKSKLAASTSTWKICSWHENMAATQVGGKGDSVGWPVHEECRKGGAIIATAHEHSYERTKTIIDFPNQTVDPSCNLPNFLCVALGKTFLFVSGLGGNSVRDQQRCLPSTAPYGCKGEWAKIYTSNQNATFGALFIIFNYNGDPNKAHGYFKNVDGQIIDEFDVTASGGNPPPTGQPTNPPTGNPTNPPPTVSAPPGTTVLSFPLVLHGLGIGGDNQNPNGGGNPNPVRKTRNVTVTLTNSSNTVLPAKQGTATYDGAAGIFVSNLTMDSSLSTGSYLIKVKADNYLGKSYTGIQTITKGQVKLMPSLALIAGDANNDNQLSVLDYNMLLDCFSDLTPAKNCSDQAKKLATDITDDGSVNQFDYNLFLRELSVQSGQ